MKAAQEIATLEHNLLYHQVVVNTHINRFRVTYPEFFKLKETVKLVEYFFNRVYNRDGKQERDRGRDQEDELDALLGILTE